MNKLYGAYRLYESLQSLKAEPQPVADPFPEINPKGSSKTTWLFVSLLAVAGIGVLCLIRYRTLDKQNREAENGYYSSF
jgi:hypothetical protein